MFNHEQFVKELEKLIPYLLEEERFSTFKSWVFPKDAPCSAQKLAEAGFIFVGNKQEPDTVKCFLCEKTLDGWDSTDDPWEEHIKHAPKCSFAQLHEDNLTVRQYCSLRNELVQKCIDHHYDNQIKQIEEVFNEMVEHV